MCESDAEIEEFVDREELEERVMGDSEFVEGVLEHLGVRIDVYEAQVLL
jgi:hypothetical protein